MCVSTFVAIGALRVNLCVFTGQSAHRYAELA